MVSNPVEVRDGWRILGLVVRVVLLLALLWGALVAVLSSSPSPRTPGEFRAAVAAGRISSIGYRTVGEELYRLRWAEGPLIWHETSTVPIGDGPQIYSMAEFQKDVAGIPERVSRLDGTDDSRGILPGWPFRAPTLGGIQWIGAAWFLSFLIMLGSVPRLGNRWAWFWLFTVGQIGAIVFLLLEPRPLWYGAGRRPAPRGRLTGGQGCLASIGLGFLSAAAAAGVGWLAGLVLG
ncbi:hypothetical protein FHR32_002917 [Streptosporangium album]|uniref:Uncharacterized protein n=1 Tax=Streptosporangium album TaxID=47479 RepID=A0A7W7RUY1_9ACTN|nr:hypothetical protein [Streptosporangium album]MBB4938612.1 hypothetical protein [Streptosporangium album]